jgi:hypothetical protein
MELKLLNVGCNAFYRAHQEILCFMGPNVELPFM